MSHVLITGASSGIGAELARLFAADGCHLTLVARSRDRLEAMASELGASGSVSVQVVAEDLSDPAAPSRVHEAVSVSGRPVDILVNNAGFGTNGPFIQLDPQRELEMIQVNISALVHLTRLFLPGMVERGAGRVLNIASTAGFQPGPGMATYYATKAFVISFSEAIAHEVKGSGVTVTCHCPGATESEFARTAGSEQSKLFQGPTQVATARAVAEHAHRAAMTGRRLAVHGAMNKVGAFSVRLAPRSWLTAIAASLNQRA